jgi:hypothetical protein
MSQKFPGGIISKTAPVPTGPFENGTAPGIWTLEQQAEFVRQGIWPIAGNVPNYIEDVFSTYLYTGNSAVRFINNGIDLFGKGGMVWIKSRSSATNNELTDTVRSVSNSLVSNTTAAQTFDPNGVVGFDGGGFFVGTGSNYNNSGATYVSWAFCEQPKFFDVVTYTGNGANRTIAHNLGSVPGFIIIKSTSAAENWNCYHRSLGAGNSITLNTTSASTPFGAGLWNSTAPTATEFSLGDSGGSNGSGQTYVAYLFAHDAGGFGLTGTDNVISCGSYTTPTSGNAVINLGYEPQWVMIKRSDGVANWELHDVMRGFSQETFSRLYPNLSNAEQNLTGNYIFPTATGFEITSSSYVASATYIYIAIRRGPMKVPTDGTSVFAPNTSASTASAITTGFPIDMQMWAVRGGNGNNFSTVDRLRGVSSNSSSVDHRLVTSSTNEELVGIADGSLAWNNTGYTPVTSGSIVAENFRRAPGFFDVVCYTGTGVAANITHNLGVAPELVIVKARSGAINQNWNVCFANTGANNLVLNDDRVAFTDSSRFPDTGGVFFPTYFKVGTANGVNNTGYTYVAYLFASCPGVSKVGSYTGTGALQTVNCGFTTGARFVLIKRTDSTGDWFTYDSARGITSGNDPYLFLNSTAAEVTSTNYVDTTGVGFQVTAAAPAGLNASGGTFIFLAIA